MESVLVCFSGCNMEDFKRHNKVTENDAVVTENGDTKYQKEFGSYVVKSGWVESKTHSQNGKYFYVKDGQDNDSRPNNISINAGTNKYKKEEHEKFREAIYAQLANQVAGNDSEIMASGSTTSGVNFNISGACDRADVFIQTILWKPVLWNSIPKHSSQFFMFIIYNRFMTHQSKEISSGQSRRTSPDNCYLFSCPDIGRRCFYFVRRNLIHRVFFQTTDIDRRINNCSSAFSFTGMLADHGTGRRERIRITNHINCSCIIPFLDQCNVFRNIDMRRTKRLTWNRLCHVLNAAVMFDMTFILIRELFQTVQDQICSCNTNSAVRSSRDHPAHIMHLFQCFTGCVPVQNFLQQTVNFNKTIPAWNTFSAGLVHGNLKQRPVKNQRTHPRRIRTHPGFEFLQHNIDSIIHAAFRC